MLKTFTISLAVAMMLGASAQAQPQSQVPADTGNPTPTFRINVVSRSTPAVSYKHRSGATKVDFQGTDLMPSARGKPKLRASAARWKSKWNFQGWTGQPASAPSI